jgi:hypothetical protein
LAAYRPVRVVIVRPNIHPIMQPCFPLLVEIFKPDSKDLDRFPYLSKSPYSGAHQD